MGKGSRSEGKDEEGKEDGKEEGKEDSEKRALTAQDESSQAKRKLHKSEKSQDKQKKWQRDCKVERIQFGCSPCKYRTFYEDETGSHLDGKFHKEHFRYIGTKLSKQTADFLQEYDTNKTKKTEELQKTVEDLDGLIQQSYRDQHLTQEIAMEHFVKKVEEAHCAACVLFIPMQFGINQKHLKTMDNNQNLRGENHSPDNPEEEKKHDEVGAGTLGKRAPREATGLTEAMPAQSPCSPGAHPRDCNINPSTTTRGGGEPSTLARHCSARSPDPRHPGPRHGRGRGERGGP